MKKLSKKGALWCFRHPHEDIHIITGDSDVTLFDIGSHASRSMYVIGNAVVDAGQYGEIRPLYEDETEASFSAV